MRSLVAILCALCLVPVVATRAQEPSLTRLLRYPDVSRDKIVFVYGGDLWVVESSGGTARRLTSGPGEELFPKFSPDGRSIAFTGQYSGTRQVYVIPTEGGEPRQLTFYNDVGEMPPRGGVDNQVMDWTPDGTHVLFNAHRLPWSDRMARPYVVPAGGGMERPLAVPEGGTAAYSPDGTKLVYAPVSREFRTWKRYRGGRNSDLWVYDLAANTAEAIVESPYTDHLPAWVGGTIYFASDREGGKHNLWAYDVAARRARRVTSHSDFDVLWPSGGPSSVVYENGGYVYRLDAGSAKSERVPIRVYGDFAETVPYFEKVRDNIQGADVSPTGVRAVFEARGDVYTVPAKEGEPRNLTSSQGVRERDVSWSPDGRWIAYLSDRTGEYEIYVRRHDGTGEERRVTSGLDAWTFAPVWSPDSKKLAFGDKKQRLRYVEVDTGRIVDCDRTTRNDPTVYTWSPDSRWIAYTKTAETQYSTIWAYSLEQARAWQLTSGLTNDANPVFDPKGRYLYFTSNRDFNLTFSNFEFNYVYTNPTRVYVGILAKDGPALFLPRSDEERPREPAPESPRPPQPPAPTAPAPAPAQQPAPAAAPPAGAQAVPANGQQVEVTPPPAPAVKIDVEGFEQRVRAIPGAPGAYFNLSATDAGVLWATTPSPGAPPRVELYNLDAKEKQTILEGVGNYSLSANGKTLLYQGGAGYGIVAVQAGRSAAEGQLALDKLETKVDPRLEWRQMYVDAWRVLRDWFYDPGMHGNDWNAIRHRYEPLVEHVATRADLDAIFAELAGELNAGHAYVSPGEARVRPTRVETGLLGAEIVADPSGAFRVAKIYPGENWHDDFRSPLTEPGVDVKAGDYILAVDGRPAREVKNFYELMEGKADRVVTLTVNGRPEAAGSREERVRPIRKETNVRYLDWVLSRRAMVERLSGGRVGYIHLPNTALEGNRELFKYFYPQSNKEALVIDDRYNGGGFIPDRMIELLDRPVLNYWAQRGLAPTSTPAFSHSGPKAVLVNGYSASGGDAFPYYFKKRGLGRIVGTRTWGGLIGISGNPNLVDGGAISAPTFRFMSTEGQWAVEGVGVPPDVEVVDRPDAVARGEDPTLERGVRLLMEELGASPRRAVQAPAVTVER